MDGKMNTLLNKKTLITFAVISFGIAIYQFINSEVTWGILSVISLAVFFTMAIKSGKISNN